MVVLMYTLMHHAMIYLSIHTSHTHILQKKDNYLEVKITTFFDDYLLFIIVTTPLNLLITAIIEEFQDSGVSQPH